MPGAWVSAAVAVAGAYNSYEQGQAAQDAADAQNQRAADMARAKEERFSQYYSPLERQITEEAARGYAPDYAGRAARIQADVGAAFDKSREIANRSRDRYGIGTSEGINKDIEIARALSEVDATNRAYQDERNRADTLGFDRQYKTLQLGYGLPSEATGIYQQQAGVNANQAAAYSRDTAAGIGAAGNFLARGLDAYGRSTQATTPAPVQVDYSGTNMFAGQSPANYGSSAEVTSPAPIYGYGAGTGLGTDYLGTSPDYSVYSGYGSYGYAEGGPVVASTPMEAVNTDAIPARLTHGEFVNDPDTVAYYGLKHFHDLKAKAAQGLAQIRGGPPSQPQMARA